MPDSALHTLQEVFGYEQFRGHQAAVIEALLAGRDALVLMPTGGGKSLCYQVPALHRDGVAIVVSPLLSLMKDQVEALRANGIRAAFINSSLTYQEQQHVEFIESIIEFVSRPEPGNWLETAEWYHTEDY